ncbi:MAG TPA: cation:proton antiporter [Polyangiaceae bacterium]|nr:cation:proton antiporter [Polyangiaceae bacterium]
MEFQFLEDLLVVLALGGVVVYLLRLIKLPPIVGLLLAGAAMGPHGMSLVGDVHRVEILAEIGVIFLLFTIGLEFSLAQLLKMWRVLLGAGGGQVLLTIGAVAGVTFAMGNAPGKAAFFGFLAAMSSTAIVLRLLGERAELGTPVGRIALGILLFQDLCIVPLMLLTPYLAGAGGGGSALLGTLAKAAAVVVGVVLLARWVVPPVLMRVVKTRSRELFLTLLLVLCLGTAYLTSLSGLSLALGAFLAGLAISESEYSHQAMAEAIPFRDAFGSLFFISIGMLMDAVFVAQNLPLVLAVVLAILAIKTLTAALPAFAIGYPLHLALTAGFSLSQVGEFAFVLSRSGRSLELIDSTEYQVFLSGSVLTMVVTPGLLHLGRVLAKRLPQKALGMGAKNEELGERPSAHPDLHDHVVIAGYGVNGQNLARALAAADIPYVILEMNPETVRAARGRGEPIHYGDCTRAPVLQGLGIEKARMYVVAISDPASTRQSVSLARSHNAALFILVRTRFVAEMAELRKLGADEVIPEEFETSIEIFARVLDRFSVPKNLILDLVSQVRGGMYDMLRSPRSSRRSLMAGLEGLEGVQIERLYVKQGSSAEGQSLAELQLRQATGASVLAIQRAGQVHGNPPADYRLLAGDVLMVVGDQKAIDAALEVVDPGIQVA